MVPNVEFYIFTIHFEPPKKRQPIYLIPKRLLYGDSIVYYTCDGWCNATMINECISFVLSGYHNQFLEQQTMLLGYCHEWKHN